MKERLTHVPPEAPSIGPRGLSFDEGGNRIRWIVEKLIDSKSDLERILAETEDYELKHPSTTRSVIRTFLPSGSLDLGLGRFGREAEILLSGDLEGVSLFYLSKNDPNRRSPDQVLDQEREILQGISKRNSKTPLSVFEKTAGYKMEKLRGELSPLDHQRLKDMYGASFTSYPFDIGGSIKAMVESGKYQVWAARAKADGFLYAVCVTEQMVIDFPDGRKFTMREMGDSAKMPEVNGLNAPLKLMLIEEAFKDGVDLVFCESRAALAPVNAVNNDIGMQFSGFLVQHTRIGGEGIDEKSDYGNMNVWALNSDGIRRIGQEVQRALMR